MKIESLSKEDQLGLCRDVERACGARLRDLRSFADPGDQPLKKVLDERLEDWRDQMRALDRPDRGPGAALAPEDLERFLRERFPSRKIGTGEGPLSREVALYLAECLEEERSRFYHDLAGAAGDPEARALFQKLADRDDAHLKFLRTVTL
jgi:rubrerythrin